MSPTRILAATTLAACLLGLAGHAGAQANATVKAKPAKTAPAMSQPQSVTKITTVEGITEYRLANGLQVLVFPDATRSTYAYVAPTCPTPKRWPDTG